MQLQAVISQHLVPSIPHGRVAAFEVMLINTAVSNLIRDSKVHQLNSVIYSCENQGMQSMDTSILELYKNGLITKDNAMLYATDPDSMMKKLIN